MTVSDAIVAYVAALVRHTRELPSVSLGASPRAAVHLLAASKAWARISGRGYVLPDDVVSLVPAVLAAPPAAHPRGRARPLHPGAGPPDRAVDRPGAPLGRRWPPPPRLRPTRPPPTCGAGAPQPVGRRPGGRPGRRHRRPPAAAGGGGPGGGRAGRVRGDRHGDGPPGEGHRGAHRAADPGPPGLPPAPGGGGPRRGPRVEGAPAGPPRAPALPVGGARGHPRCRAGGLAPWRALPAGPGRARCAGPLGLGTCDHTVGAPAAVTVFPDLPLGPPAGRGAPAHPVPRRRGGSGAGWASAPSSRPSATTHPTTTSGR